ncbi:hypothetical protein HID58_043561 [Brassica napus]|uniref:Uncharacterized protein n=1 Tax=Brassica napus TaxID=3708 RepID=A0ABQ8BIB8_BRANA|nr:hypothetical protein HID58_043561 [Brassica napus]
MLVPDGSKVPPITLFNDKDVEIMTSVRDYMSEAVLYVTSGPGLVAKYQFFGRSPFTINDKTYLEEGITEDQHRQAIQSSMVYAFPDDQGENQDPAEFPSLTIDDIISMEQGVTFSPDDPSYYQPGDEVLYGEPVTLEELQNAEANFQGTMIVHQATPLEVETLNIWRENTQKEPYWDGMMDEEDDYEVYVTQSPHPTQGVEDVPLAPNRRVNAPQPATIIIIDDEDDASYTGSSNGINENDNITSAPPPEDIGLIANEQPKSAPAIRKGNLLCNYYDVVNHIVFSNQN